jgi:hypothetical protein
MTTGALTATEKHEPTVAASAVETADAGSVSDARQTETADTTAEPDADAINARPVEPKAASTDSGDVPGPPATTAEVVAEVEDSCHTIGPLAREDEAAAIRAQLAAAGYSPRLRTDRVRKPSGYWVYMPAMRASEARRIVAELESHGMTDYYIGKQNYISLGIFSGESKARLRLERIKQLGFDAILDQRYRTRPEYWLDVRTGDTPLPASEAWAKLLEEHQAISVKRVDCE